MKKADKVAALELLMGIKGVGEATAEKLLDAFKSIDKISKADKDALLDAGLNSRAATAVLKWSKTQDKQRKKPTAKKKAPAKKAASKPAAAPEPKPEPEPAPKVVAAVPEPPKPAPKPIPAAKPVVPVKESAARIPIPLPFGNAKDVRVRTTPPPEVVDMSSLKDGGPIRTKPLPQAARLKTAKPAPKPVRPKAVKAAPKPVPRPAQRPTAKAGMSGTPMRLANSKEKVFVDRSDTLQSPRGVLIRVYDGSNKTLGYGKIVYGQVHIIKPGR
jgi:hypothetical protein